MKKRIQKIIVSFLLFLVLFGQVGSLPGQAVRAGNITCDMGYQGSRPAFKASGFDDIDDLRTYYLEWDCDRCTSGPLRVIPDFIFDSSPGYGSSLSNADKFPQTTEVEENIGVRRSVSVDGTDLIFSAVLSEDVLNGLLFKRNLLQRIGDNVVCDFGTTTIGGIAVGASAVASGFTAGAVVASISYYGNRECHDAFNSFYSELDHEDVAPVRIKLKESKDGETVCEEILNFSYELILEDAASNSNFDPYQICKTNLNEKTAAYQACITCFGNEDGSGEGGIWTAVGCIDKKPQVMIEKIIYIGIGIAGGIALLMILASAFMLTVSQGDVKKTSDAKERLTAAVIGLIFIIFSVTILQFIGEGVLKIPGFGG